MAHKIALLPAASESSGNISSLLTAGIWKKHLEATHALSYWRGMSAQHRAD